METVMDISIVVLENAAVVGVILAAISGFFAWVAAITGFSWLAKASPVLAAVADTIAGNVGRASNAADVLRDVHENRVSVAEAIRRHVRV